MPRLNRTRRTARRIAPHREVHAAATRAHPQVASII
jgi:hypothetical protein